MREIILAACLLVSLAGHSIDDKYYSRDYRHPISEEQIEVLRFLEHVKNAEETGCELMVCGFCTTVIVMVVYYFIYYCAFVASVPSTST